MAEPDSRIRAVGAIALVGLCVLLLRAAQVQLLDGAQHAATAAAVRTEREELPAPRGAILDRWGNQLAVSQESYSIDLTPGEFVDSAETAKQIRTALGISSARLNRELRKRFGYLAGPYSSNRVHDIRSLRGVYVNSSLNRFYPHGNLAAAVLGRPASNGIAASGIERVMDTLLQGTPGSAVVLRDHVGGTYQTPGRLDAFPTPGHNVHVTLDIDLQDLVERSLSDAMEKLEALSGNVVIIDPRSGEILAVASRSRESSSTVSSFTSAFEPGSTAKIFAAAALLDRGLVAQSDSVWGEDGEYKTPHRTITDDHNEGWMTLFDVVRRSSNIGIAKLSSRLTRPQQFAMLRDFGLGTPTGIEFPAESPGILRRPDAWSMTSSASLAMGYEVATTMLQLAQAYAALANDGVMVQPTLIKRVVAVSGEVIYRHEPRPVRRVISAAHADRLRGMLRAVVYDGGTGEAAALATYEVAGKTGTARRVIDGRYVPGSHTATFISLFPASDPQFVMVVKLDDPAGTYAAASAVPLTRSMLEQLLAGRTPVLDRASLLVSSDPIEESPRAVDPGTAPFHLRLPRKPEDIAVYEKEIPDVTGDPIRLAARKLHDLEFQVRVEGWGPSCVTQPATGTSLPSGSTVTLVCTAARGGG